MKTSADAVCFLRERLHFIRPDGASGRSSFASVLMAWGSECVEAIRRADLGWTCLQNQHFDVQIVKED